MINNLKINLSNKIHNNFNFHYEKLKNKEVLKSYNQIIKLAPNKRSYYKSLLIDGGFYNLGYLFRLQLLRAAIKSNKLNEKAFIWDCNINICKHILKSIGINDISYLIDNFKKDIFLRAELIANQIKTSADILNIKLPYDIPSYFLYDSILKSQRLSTVNINDKNFKRYIYKFLYSVQSAEEMIKSFKPDLIVMSHCINYQCSPMSWIGSKHGIQVIVLGGGFGVPRLWRISNPKDLSMGNGHPLYNYFTNLSNDKKYKLMAIGKKYISKRISGKSSDIGGRYAFQGKTKKINELEINKKNKKIIAIYASSFFDFPHTYGMNRFLDIKDWVKSTIKIAKENKKVIWLLKPHPLEEWYGGAKLTEIFPEELPENIIILPYKYSGKEIINIADALVTLHGTSAIEFAAMGKPVLVADKGWYHDFNFVTFPKSKEEYLHLLNNKWYENINIKKTKGKAELFAGMFFGIPKWQENSLLPDDSDKEKLRCKIPELINSKSKIIKKEITLINKWLNSDLKDYHSFKILNSYSYSSLINN